jgi:hypothetical protein
MLYYNQDKTREAIYMKRYKLRNEVKLLLLLTFIIALTTYLFATRTELPKTHNGSIKIIEKN